MSRSLRIAVADDEPRMCDYFQKILPRLGHEVVAVAQTGRQLVQQCLALKPDLVITDITMPDMDGIDAARAICRDEPIPIILVSAFHDPDLIARAEAGSILAYLVKPIKQEDLAPAIAIATRRFAEFQTMFQEAASLRQALQDRKLIERAKGVLMKRMSLDEAAAFSRLQKMARDKNRKLVEVAEMILTVEDVYQAEE